MTDNLKISVFRNSFERDLTSKRFHPLNRKYLKSNLVQKTGGLIYAYMEDLEHLRPTKPKKQVDSFDYYKCMIPSCPNELNNRSDFHNSKLKRHCNDCKLQYDRMRNSRDLALRKLEKKINRKLTEDEKQFQKFIYELKYFGEVLQ